MVSTAKRRLVFPFASFPFPVFSHHLSPSFSYARLSIWSFFTSLFNFVQSLFSSSLFRGVSRREDEIIPPCDFSGSQIQLLASSCASCMVFYLPCFVVSDPSLGRKWPVQGKKAFNQPNLHGNENKIPRKSRGLCRAYCNSEGHCPSSNQVQK